MPSPEVLFASLALAGIVAAARPAAADDPEVPDPDGWDIALRAGYAIPEGSLAENTDFDALMSGAIPFTFEVGRRFNRDHTVGVFFQYGVGRVRNGEASGCGGGDAGCSSADYRFGLEYLLRINEPDLFTRWFTPWVGLDVGYEILTISANTPSFDSSLTLTGFEAMLQAGGDFNLTPTFSLGPYVGYALGEFGTSGLGGVNAGASPGLHGWLQLGLRAAWSLSSP